MKDRIKIIVGAVALLCIVVFSVVIATAPAPDQGQPEAGTEMLREEGNTAPETGMGDDQSAQPQEETGDAPEEETAPTEEEQPPSDAGQGEDPAAPSGETGNTGSTGGTDSTGATGNTGGTGGTQPSEPVLPELPEEQEEPETITFPYTIPNTGIQLQKLDSYDGIFLEDGSDSSVSGIFSAVVKNNGGKDVEYARITLDCDGTSLVFELSDLPAGATAVVQEASKTSYRSGSCQNCAIDLAETDGLEQSEGIVSVQEGEDGSLTVSNLTGQAIPSVRIFYKFYMAEEDVYVGGITYTAKLTNLEAGGSQTIVPSHYSQGYSKVVMVRTYDTTD